MERRYFKLINSIDYIKYWFINSEGDIASAIFGKKKWADDWRMKIHNYYSTKELARTALDDMKAKYI